MRWNVDLHRLRIKIPLSCIPNQNNTQDVSFNFDGLIRENRISRMVRRGVETHDVLVCVKTSERVMHHWVKSPVALLLFSIFGLGTHHDDVIKWKHFPRNWPFVRGIHRSPVNSLHKGQWRGALVFSLICVWINDWVNKREAGDLRRYRAHYDVIVMEIQGGKHWIRQLLVPNPALFSL